MVRAWDDVAKACGGFETEALTYAPYYRMAEGLDADTLQRIEAAPEPGWVQGRGFGIANGRLTVFG